MRVILLFALSLSTSVLVAQHAFRVVPLGVKGGIDEQNLSAYLIAPSGQDQFVSLDAGTLFTGVKKSVSNGAITGPPEIFLKNNVRAYLISHAHLDHISGLILNSTDDIQKEIYSLPKCLEIIKNHYFNWESWPNFGNDGNAPVLKKYQYYALSVGREVRIENTEMFVTAFPLSHSAPYESAAFLVRAGNKYALYFGDTGPDQMEKSNRIKQIWEVAAPLIRNGNMSGIFLEVSYPDEQPDSKLYGHLTPKWFMKEMENLSEGVGSDNMRGLKVIVTHIKPTGENEKTIRRQLLEANSLRLNLIFPEQGVGFDL